VNIVRVQNDHKSIPISFPGGRGASHPSHSRRVTRTTKKITTLG
jgi:hypothetical protein